MKKDNFRFIIDLTLLLWVLIWIYYAIFNWDVFVAQLNTSIGFSLVKTHPFVVFFAIGLVMLLIIKFAFSSYELILTDKQKSQENKVALLEKDIEIYKLKEVLFKMQSDEMNKSSTNLTALHAKIDDLTRNLSTSEENEGPQESEKKNEKI